MAKELLEDGHFRAGLIKMPFCIAMGYIPREPTFFLGEGFFAALLVGAFSSTGNPKKALRPTLPDEITRLVIAILMPVSTNDPSHPQSAYRGS